MTGSGRWISANRNSIEYLILLEKASPPALKGIAQFKEMMIIGKDPRLTEPIVVITAMFSTHTICFVQETR